MRNYAARFFRGNRRVAMLTGKARSLPAFLKRCQTKAKRTRAERFAVRYSYKGNRYLPVQV